MVRKAFNINRKEGLRPQRRLKGELGLVLGALLILPLLTSIPSWGASAGASAVASQSSSLRSVAERELNSQRPTGPSSESGTLALPSPATVQVAPVPAPQLDENFWHIQWGLQSFQPLGQIPIPGLSSIDLSDLPTGSLMHLELKSQLFSRVGGFAHLAWAQQSLSLFGPTGAQVERTRLNSFVFLTGVEWELRRWGERPWILSLRPSFGQISHIASSSWIEANSSQSQWLWSLGPALAWEFYPGFRTQLRSEWRDTLSRDPSIGTQNLNLSWALQMTLGASR